MHKGNISTDVGAPLVDARGRRQAAPLLALLLAILPAVVIAIAIMRYSVNVPRWDQWGFASFLQGIADGEWSWQTFLTQLFAQHNEHRQAIPRLIWTGLAWFTGWNTRWEMGLQWAIVCLISFGIYRLAPHTVCHERKPALLLTALANLILFGPLQWENWMWGFQLAVPIPLACIVACLCLCYGRRSTTTVMIWCIVLSFVSTFTSANGMLCWLLVLPALWVKSRAGSASAKDAGYSAPAYNVPRERPDDAPAGPGGRPALAATVWLTAYVLFFAASVAFYLKGYHRPQHHPALDIALKDPLLALRYFLAYTGHSLGYGWGLPPVQGSILSGAVLLVSLVLLSAALAVIARKDRGLWYSTWPWFALVIYSLVSGLMIVVGRLGFGIEQALSSRYVSFSVCMVVGLIFLAAMVIKELRDRQVFSRNSVIVLISVLTTWMTAAHLASFPSSLQAMRGVRDEAMRGRIALAFLDVLPDRTTVQRILYPRMEHIVARDLKNAGWLDIPMLDSPDIRQIEDRQPYDSQRIGYVDGISALANGTYGLSGWAVLPWRRSPAHAVIVTARTGAGEEVAMGYVSLPHRSRPDVAREFRERRYANSGWGCRFSPTNLPPDAVAISAWAYDALSGKAYRIESDPALQLDVTNSGRSLLEALLSSARRAGSEIPVSRLPGPPRESPPWTFVLNEKNSRVAIGIDDPVNERWSDVMGNHYATDFVRRFKYSGKGRRNPLVRIRVEPEAETVRGRIEARRLKPNFAYQLKLRGCFSDRRAFETIGRAGRWRLPGRGTNYTDADYENFPEKHLVEAYILFDYFVTDAEGSAVRDFALDSSLHVLFHEWQSPNALPEDHVTVVVDASDPDTYTRPKRQTQTATIFAQREPVRYQTADQVIRLPPGRYEAEIVLVEESFHASTADDGYWATVCRLPVTFSIVDPASDHVTSPPTGVSLQ